MNAQDRGGRTGRQLEELRELDQQLKQTRIAGNTPKG